MNSRPPRYETILYLLAALLALGLRFARLGELPLSDSEARLALDALHIVNGQSPALPSHVAYTNLTAILFFVFGPFNFLARFWPALAGSLLALAPLLFRDWLKPRAAILLAFFLAIDPAFVALSRQAGSPILAVAASLLAAGFWFRQKPQFAGVFLALAFLSGPAFWAGLLGLLLAWMLAQFMSPETGANADESAQADTPDTATQRQPDTTTLDTPAPPAARRTLNTDHWSLLTALMVTLLSISTLLLFAPQGLGAWTASLPEYLRGWAAPITVPAGRLFLALGAYQLFGVIFALIAIARGWMRLGRRVIRLSLWAVVALLLAAFYPARQTSDLAWALIPLWALAALELSRHLEFVRSDRIETAGVSAFTLVFLVFAWLSFNVLPTVPFPSPTGYRLLLSVFVSLLIFVVSTILVGFGWSGRVARVGAAWGAALALGAYTLGAAWGATGLRDANAVELWDASARIAQAGLLTQTADEISNWATGDAHELQIIVQGVDSPALLWSLRNHNPSVVLALDPASAPALIVTSLRGELGLPAAYRGQDFFWRVAPAWDALPPSYLRWLAYREFPSSQETIVLWVRSDLFIDSGQ